MKKKSILLLMLAFLMISGMCLMSSCGNDSDADEVPNSPPIPDSLFISIVGDYVTDVSGKRGIARWDHERFPIPEERYHNIYYIETANGDRYYLLALTPPDFGADENGFLGGDLREEFNKEFVEGATMEFSGKVYSINPEYVAVDELFAEIVKTTKVYIMRAPEFTIKRVSDN